MNYKVLARKWRPQKFSDVVGQQHIIKAITHSFSLNKIHHAYILIGTKGIGKTTIARLFAKGLNCEKGITSTICGKCKNCKDIELGCFIDLIEIDAASRTKVEETREFLDNIQYMPSIGRFKIYLIDEVHMLSKYSFNALLKMLEEPPAHVKFILITTEYKKIPETILSRCLQFYLKPLNFTQISTQLAYIFDKENIIIEKLALESLAHAARGSMRDALNLSEQAIVLGNQKITTDVINSMFGIINIEYPLCLIENLIDGNIDNILHQIDSYSVLGVNWDHLLSEMLIILKKIAIGQFLSSSLIIKENENQIQDTNKRIYELSRRITPENVQLYYQILLLGRKELPYTPNYRIGIEITMLRALAFKPNKTNIKKDYKKNKENISSKINKSSNCNFLKNLNTNNKNCSIVKDNQSEKKINHINNDLLCLDSKNNKHNSNNITTDSVIFASKESEVLSNTTKKLIEARLTLSEHKKCNILNKNISDLITTSHKKITTNILKRFSDINKNINNTTVNVAKTNTNYIKIIQSNCIKEDTNDIHKNYQKIPIFMKEILQQAMQDDPWILQIRRLSLPRLAKKMAMHSWKEEIATNKICLHTRSDYYYLNSVELHSIIQKAFSKYAGHSISLWIKKDDNTKIKTPMEYIRILYKEKILKAKKEFSKDPYIKKIKEFFDAKYNEDDITIL